MDFPDTRFISEPESVLTVPRDVADRFVQMFDQILKGATRGEFTGQINRLPPEFQPRAERMLDHFGV